MLAVPASPAGYLIESVGHVETAGGGLRKGFTFFRCGMLQDGRSLSPRGARCSSIDAEMVEGDHPRAAGASAHGPRHGLRRVLSAMFAGRASPPGSVRAQLQQRMAKGRHDAVAVL